MKDILKLGLFLMTVCLGAALSLAYVNRSTKPIIEEQKRRAQKAALKEVLPKATVFNRVDNTSAVLELLFQGINAEGAPVGYAFKTSSKGYSGAVVIMTGMESGGRLTGIKILEMKETPGLGAKARESKFKDQFTGKTVGQLFLKKKSNDSGGIDAITAATITSQAVVKGVRQGAEAVHGL